MNNNNNFHNHPINQSDGLPSSYGSGTDANQNDNGVIPFSNQLRKKITRQTWVKICEILPYGKKGTLSRYKVPSEWGLLILNQFIKDSDGGIKETRINQKHWREIKVNGKKCKRDTITDLIRAFTAFGFIKKTKTKLKDDYSLFYLGDSKLWDYIDQERIFDRKCKEIRKLNRERYIDFGLDADSTQQCLSCKKHLTLFPHFSLGENLNPVCGHCWKERPQTAKELTRAFYMQPMKDKLQLEIDEQWTSTKVKTPEEIEIDTMLEEIEREFALEGKCLYTSTR